MPATSHRGCDLVLNVSLVFVGFFLNLRHTPHVQDRWLSGVWSRRRTRGRVDLGSAVNENLLQDLRTRLGEMLNGDVRRVGTQHFCRGRECCANVREASLKLADLLVSAFWEVLSSVQPSTSRWHTFEPAIVPQTGLLLIHGLGQRLAEQCSRGGFVNSPAGSGWIGRAIDRGGTPLLLIAPQG